MPQRLKRSVRRSMKLTNITKKYRRLAYLFFILSGLCFFCPFLWFSGIAIMEGVAIHEGFTIAASVLAMGIITVFCTINKIAFKSKIWLIVIMLYFIIDAFIPMLFAVAITQLLDEIIFTPLYRFYNAKYMANKEIDRRI